MKKEKKKMDKFTGYRNEPVGETEQEHQGWKKCGDVGMRSRDAGLSSGANKGGGKRLFLGRKSFFRSGFTEKLYSVNFKERCNIYFRANLF